MLWTQTLIPTLRKTPDRVEMVGHGLMLRSGIIETVMAGAHTYLPLGLRAMQRLERIARKQVESLAAAEVAMPGLLPRSLWERSGRAETLGDDLLQWTNRKTRAVLAPSHEEAVAAMAARHIGSYRQLPLRLYQITTKFRNQPRPRHGLLRSCQFRWQDVYSFDVSDEALDHTYEAMYAAYCRVLDHCSVEHIAVEINPSESGGQSAVEFAVPVETGDEEVLYCPDCGYAADQDTAEIGALDTMPRKEQLAELEKVDTPGTTTVEEVANLLGCKPQRILKTLIYLADGKPVAILIRGDRQANLLKIRRALEVETLELADADTIARVTGAPVGFAGPIGMKVQIPIWVDREIRQMVNAVTGANAADAHYTGVNFRRDIQVEHFAELRDATGGDPCPRCSANLIRQRVIPVARLVKLGTRYSELFAARFDDTSEQQRPIVMGSFHLMLDRLLAAVIETHRDERGILWPMTLAPFEVLLLPLAAGDETIMTIAERLHDELSGEGIDVLVDDRDVSPGVKFNDADLIGIPLRIVIGQRGLQQKQLELKWRSEKEPEMVDLADAERTIAEMIRAGR